LIDVHVSYLTVDEFLRQPVPQSTIFSTKYLEKDVCDCPKASRGLRITFVSPWSCENLDRRTIKREKGHLGAVFD